MGSILRSGAGWGWFSRLTLCHISGPHRPPTPAPDWDPPPPPPPGGGVGRLSYRGGVAKGRGVDRSYPDPGQRVGARGTGWEGSGSPPRSTREKGAAVAGLTPNRRRFALREPLRPLGSPPPSGSIPNPRAWAGSPSGTVWFCERECCKREGSLTRMLQTGQPMVSPKYSEPLPDNEVLHYSEPLP